jgi:thiamine kinase-like enzyme
MPESDPTPSPTSVNDLLQHLHLALVCADHPLAHHALASMDDTGLAHDHVRLVGSGWLARVPKQSQMGLDPSRNLHYQRSCFERAAPGQHTPRLHSVLAPSVHLPRGALLVEEIKGVPARLPGDLDAVVSALASLHALPLPSAPLRAPLLDAPDPLQALLEEVTQQVRYLDAARIPAAVRLAVEALLARLRSVQAGMARPERHLIAFDGHPGNFIIRPDGAAVLVDLEKCRYSYPGLDLAHASLYTSTTWDMKSHAVLSTDEVLSAYQAWGAIMGASGEAAAAWHLPLRRAMWLWSVTWCAKWRVLSRERSRTTAAGEDWSAERSEAALVEHVRDRVDHYLSVSVVDRILHEFDVLERAWKN